MKARVVSKRLARMRGLDVRKPLKLTLAHLFPPKPTFRAARLINDTRFEYKHACRVIGTSSPVLTISLDIFASWRRRRYLSTVAFIANLTRLSGKNQMMFHTQTVPIQPPETP